MPIINPVSTSTLKIAIILILIVNVMGNFLYISMAPQVYVPGQHYSTIYLYYNVDAIENSQYDININFSLNQTTEKDQTNTIFDFISCQQQDSAACVSCFTRNYDYLNYRYAKYQPCLQICNFTEASSFNSQNLLPNLFINLTQIARSSNQTFIIDNTFYPCENGSYQPQLYLEQLINITIQQNTSYGLVIKIIFVLLLQVLIIVITYIVIMFRKYSKLKKKLEYLKGQEQAQDLLNSFLGGGGNNGGNTSNNNISMK